ncbi:MAG: ATP synthase F1 subunit delta [Planctomycetaceae bacterium]|jgi:F-type H+-transporting ATPase subunit delta|nr:ATP synthase F1 subunit delta [Planctomycetaceae bacterium]
MTTESSKRSSSLDAPHDIGAARLAKVYAQAIVEAADRHQCQAEVFEELTQIVEDVLPRVDNIASVFESPRISTSDKSALVRTTFSDKVSPITLNALLVLADHERLGLLPELVIALRRELDERAGKREAILTTAHSITSDEQAAILKSVEESLGESLTAHFSVNPDLLGGLVVRIEDTVYDHSISTGLVSLAERLKQRSINEIQHRRDRLGSA